MFRGMKLGLNIPSKERIATIPNLLSAKYAAPAGLPLIADSTDYTQPLPSGLWGFLGNDQYGCCFWAAVANILMSQQANAGVPVHVFTTQDVLGWYKAYLATQGINFDPNAPSDPNTDVGTDPIAGMNWLMSQKMIVAWGQVPINGNDAHLAGGLELGGGLILGVNVPAGWMNSTTWGPNAGAIEGGHAIVGAAYNQPCDVTCLTWAEEVDLIVAGRIQYADLAIMLVTDQWLTSKGTSLQGFNLSQLQADLALVA